MAAAHYIFVLWGRNFDEAVATIFVTELRQAGQRVKVIGLDGELPVGMNGLALVPDMPLSKALTYVRQVSCLIVPCRAEQWPRLQHDPRLLHLIRDSQAAGAWLIVEAKAENRTIDWAAAQNVFAKYIETLSPWVKTYPPQEQLICYARELAKSLQQ